jgi:hypothetical protein
MRSGPVAPGMRTDSGRGPAAVIGTAAEIVISDPGLWLLGLVGFGARGGLVLLTLPVLTIPSPVLLSILFRSELGTSGTTASFDTLALVAATLTGVVVLAAILISAWAELNAVERSVLDRHTTTLRLGRPARPLAPRERSGLLLWVAAIQAAGLLPILVLVLILVVRLSGVVTSELERPTDMDLPLFGRLIRDSTVPLAGMLLVVAVVEVLVSLASRRLIVARLALLPDGAGETTEGRLALGGVLRAVRQPLRVAGIAVVSWMTALAAIVVAVVGLSLAWGATRSGLLELGRAADLAALAGASFATFLLSAVWIGALCLCGLASAFRSALWTMDTLR